MLTPVSSCVLPAPAHAPDPPALTLLYFGFSTSFSSNVPWYVLIDGACRLFLPPGRKRHEGWALLSPQMAPKHLDRCLAHITASE